MPPRRRGRPGPGQLSLFDVAEAASSDRAANQAAKRAAPPPSRTTRGTRNLRAIGAERPKEPLPPMLSFDSSRVAEAGYSSGSKTLYVRFVDGTPWNYFGVEKSEWRNFRRSASPGRYINRVLNSKDYRRGSF